MASTHRGIALLIGISNYDYEENIDSALNDVLEMSRRLSTCDYEVIEATNLEIVEIRAKVSLLMDRLDESQHREVLVYYAGHGLVLNDEHLIVGRRYDDNARSQSNEITRKCLSVERDIIDKVCSISCLEEEETRSLAVILDTCRSKANVISRSIASSSLSSDSFKLRHEVRIGILVGYACALGLKAKESGDGHHGLYTDCILKNIFEPGKRIIDALSSANFLATNRTNTGQRPFIYVNYPHFFYYSLIQGTPAPDEPQRMRDHNDKPLQTKGDKLKLEKEKHDRENKLLETEHEKLRLKKEKLEQEFQLISMKLANNRSENKREEQISDSEIMEKIYELTGGALWTRNKDRLSWQPRRCTSEFMQANGRTTYISLPSNNLNGMIPQELGRLSYLHTLNLSRNKLRGAIPKELGELKNLEHLALHGNQLTGAIPLELGELSKLKLLSLYGNQLAGEIPKELGKLSKLEELWLNDNQLGGAIPLELVELSKLKLLSLYGNQLAGGPPVIPRCHVRFHSQRYISHGAHF